MRRSSTIHDGLCSEDSSSKKIEEFDFNEFKGFYKTALENLFGCCLEETLQTVEKRNKDEQKEFSIICIKIFENTAVSSIETQKFLDIIKQNYNIIFSQIDTSHRISHLVCSSPNFEAYKSSIQKLPRLLFILRKLNKVSNDQEIISTSLELLKLILNHIILPESIRERLEISEQNIGTTMNTLYLDRELPSAKLLDILFCGNLTGQNDNFANFKHLVHAKPEGLYLLFSPLIGLDSANIWYTSSPKQYDPQRKFLKYFDYLPDAQTVVAISAISEEIGENTITLPENFKKYLKAKYSKQTPPENQIERYIADNIDKILSSQLTRSLIEEDGKTVILYQLPAIDDLYYGHHFTQELIVECLIAIEQDMKKSGLENQSLIINCEKGTNRSKAIYEAMVGLRHQNSPELMLSAIQATSPENMSHFTAYEPLSEYIYLGYDEEGARISQIKELALSKAEISNTCEPAMKKVKSLAEEQTFCLTL